MRTRARLLWDLGLEEEEEAMDLEVCVCGFGTNHRWRPSSPLLLIAKLCSASSTRVSKLPLGRARHAVQDGGIWFKTMAHRLYHQHAVGLERD
jgi:hypothetical protein